MNLKRLALGLLFFTLLITSFARGQDAGPVSVEPGDLTKRADLIGREVVVDDRVSRFQWHPETGYDQIFLTRAPEVSFEVPKPLRPSQSPSVVAVRVRGTLRLERGRWWVDVSHFEPEAADLDRLNRAVALLPRSDAESRYAWARWAETRGRAFHDEHLITRAREVLAEAIRADSDRPSSADPAGHWLALADRARTAKVPEPEPSAQAHRGFRARLALAKSAVELKTLVDRIDRAFPEAAKAVSADLSRWEKPYRNAPADAYRAAPVEARRALDHQLRADAVQELLELKAAEAPKSLLSLADEAERSLPDRPDLARRFLTKGLALAETEIGSLRLDEVEALAKVYRDRLQQPEKGRDVILAWLSNQKNQRLSPRDAGGRIALADQYENLLNDRETAVSLLREAWKIDYASGEVADAFRRRGFRKVNGDWVEGTRNSAPAAAASSGTEPSAPVAVALADPAPLPARSESLRGSTAEEVRVRMGGRPNRKTWVSSQGQLVEQWVYFGPRLDQYVNLLRKAGEPQPHVISYYSLPHGPVDRPTAP